MKRGKIVCGVLAVFVTMPIWFYLLHFILKATNAGELQWFLFWIYLPVGFLVSILNSIVNADSRS